MDIIFDVVQMKIYLQIYIFETLKLLQSLGFTIHPDKSIFKPTHKITFLGYVDDTTPRK